MKADALTPAMERALLALSAYHYLMPRQFTRLSGFPANVDAIHKLLRRFQGRRRRSPASSPVWSGGGG